jgi:restriction system protein
LDALRELGGSGTPREVKDRVLERVTLPQTELERTTPKLGLNAVENEIHWARDQLKRVGLIDPSVRGVWSLTPKGRATHLTTVEARKLRAGHPGLLDDLATRSSDDDALVPSTEKEPVDWREELLLRIAALTPSGFEQLCKRVLRESGFSEVHVTGQSGDGGIDGNGILQVNELVSFRVLFQCKKYQSPVGVAAIRDFRGAMTGRTDKGIFLTTSSFTTEAEREAVRDGAPPLELVNGQKLVTLMERLGLGLKPRTVYDVDAQFFEEFI